MKGFNELNSFKNLKFHSVIPQDILQAVELLGKIGYEAEDGFSADDAAKHNGICAWDDGEITEGWLDYNNFEQVTLEDLQEMVGEDKEVLWLNKFTLEESYLAVGVHWRGIGWVEVPEGATFATGDKDNFVFRKDGWYYDNQTGWWIKSNVTIQNLYTHELVKLFWVKGGVKDNIFTLERLLGCEVLFENRNLFIEDIVNSYSVEVGDRNYQDCARVSDLIFFTEDGDELTFDEYVKLYYGDSCV